MAKRRERGQAFNAGLAGLKKVAKSAPAAWPPPRATPATATAQPLSSSSLPSDAELFYAATRDAAPLVAHKTRLPAPEPVAQARLCDEQLALAELEDLVNGVGAFRLTESEEHFSGLAPGVNLVLLEQLRAGHFAFHRHLDLHGYRREPGHQELIRFIVAARRDTERCVLVITGRGRSSPAGISVLREALPRWLSRAPLRAHVLAFCSARPVDGGAGAFYVLLRRPGVRPFGTS